ncbi:response regulator [Candidatus Solincola tengchongensis]|uniref:response regulator transcription factor n=1 Tax=Candidatus Solincola tengchongensis TaxID=2900693 RepID=UPI00257B876B|nr:response regulator [Candidatus Solincola tengchongensis]
MEERKKILIVDDDEELVRILSINFMAEGYEVCAAFDGVSAVMRAHKEHPDLIVLDVRMPAGDGLNVVEKLRSSTKTFNIPVLFLSALPYDELKEKAAQAGVVHYLTKPFELDMLLGMVRNILGIEDRKPVLKVMGA